MNIYFEEGKLNFVFVNPIVQEVTKTRVKENLKKKKKKTHQDS